MLYPDAAGSENHLRLKRWERARQWTAWKQRRAEDQTGSWLFPWRLPQADALIEYRPAVLLALFPKEIALVRFLHPVFGDNGVFLLRGGIPWEQCWDRLLRDYRDGRPVPIPFRPRRRLPPAWIEAAMRWPASAQTEWIERLRAAGLLPPLSRLDAEGVSPWLRWEEARARLLDFRVTDNPPLQS